MGPPRLCVIFVVIASCALIADFNSRRLREENAEEKSSIYSHTTSRPARSPLRSFSNLTAEGIEAHGHITTFAATPNSNFTVLEDDDKGNEDTSGRVLDLDDDFRVCRLNDAAPVMGQEAARQTRFEQIIEYQCTGQPYDDFLQLRQFPLVLKKHASSPKLQWGKRQSILPPASNNNTINTTILVVGNSHTRQFFASLQCQYADLLVSVKELAPSPLGIKILRYTFQQKAHAEDEVTGMTDNVNFDVVANHPLVYSLRWKKNLESMTGTPLREYDAVIIGHINGYDPRYANKAALWISARKYAEQNPELEIDLIKYPRGFAVNDIAKYYKSGPIIWVSMFSSYQIKSHQQAVQQMKSLKKADTAANKTRFMRAIDARQYIDEMDGEECSSDSRGIVATCVTNRTSVRYSDGHRCAGDKGGQPDLLVWDLIETLWEAFNPATSTMKSLQK